MPGLIALSQQSIQQALADATRAYVGPGRRYTTTLLADAAIISESSVKQYAAGQGTPGLVAFLKLLVILGPEWGNTLTRMAGYELVPADGADVPALALNAHAAQLLSMIAAALADDGRIDHLEEAEMLPLIKLLNAETGAWLARRSA